MWPALHPTVWAASQRGARWGGPLCEDVCFWHLLARVGRRGAGKSALQSTPHARGAEPRRPVRTIQKRVPVARVTYCSMVDSTLKMRQTRTMRKLQDRETRGHPVAGQPAPPLQAPQPGPAAQQLAHPPGPTGEGADRAGAPTTGQSRREGHVPWGLRLRAVSRWEMPQGQAAGWQRSPGPTGSPSGVTETLSPGAGDRPAPGMSWGPAAREPAGPGGVHTEEGRCWLAAPGQTPGQPPASVSPTQARLVGPPTASSLWGDGRPDAGGGRVPRVSPGPGPAAPCVPTLASAGAQPVTCGVTGRALGAAAATTSTSQTVASP